ncbi:MAG: SDR family NAD(P)-dependent oxidoreductase [Gemmatimonadetes bacterium]|nr:SDR family NAD(P)-dependent oxidoreductase [Gemmatimonadota bacterium]
MSVRESSLSPSSSSLAGRTVVVSGASDGIGRAAARAFAERGADVVMLGRNEAKTAAAARAIMSATGSRRVTWHIADLSRLDGVHEVADTILARHDAVDVLVNNAGALFLERMVTADGLERTFALDHLSYLLLTVRLLPALARGARVQAPARVVCVASRAHHDARIDLDDLQMTRRYRGWRAYANAKLGNVWTARTLGALLDPTQVVVHAMHPGVVRTRFATNNGALGRLLRRVMDLRAVTPEQGADTIVWLAESAEASASTGGYWVKRRAVTPSRTARHDGMRARHWTASLALAQLDAATLVPAELRA